MDYWDYYEINELIELKSILCNICVRGKERKELINDIIDDISNNIEGRKYNE